MSERRVICKQCHSAVWTDNDVWAPCDICGSKIWLDRSPDFAPPDLPDWFFKEHRERDGL